MSAYYNENDPFCAQWLRNLIARGLIAPGEVDERSVIDVRADELRGYRQCHFFAGIGVWSYALRLAGWPDEREVWTGSCPCQPFSAAGRASGFGDKRHLWPHWAGLIGERRPVALFGEQVASADGLGWLDFVCADLEAAGYAVGALDTCAAGVGAPHNRPRLYFVADAGQGRREIERAPRLHAQGQSRDDAAGRGAVGGFWSGAAWIQCRDGRRPVEPGSFPLVDGAAARVGRLRAYGNAIVPQAAAEFIRAYLEFRG